MTLQFNLSGKPLHYRPAHLCMVDKVPTCSSVAILESDFGGPDAVEGAHFGLNRYGQNTTGRLNCQAHMVSTGGDTFVYDQGSPSRPARCEVLECSHKSAIDIVPEIKTHELRSRMEVWSQ